MGRRSAFREKRSTHVPKIMLSTLIMEGESEIQLERWVAMREALNVIVSSLQGS